MDYACLRLFDFETCLRIVFGPTAALWSGRSPGADGMSPEMRQLHQPSLWAEPEMPPASAPVAEPIPSDPAPVPARPANGDVSRQGFIHYITERVEQLQTTLATATPTFVPHQQFWDIDGLVLAVPDPALNVSALAQVLATKVPVRDGYAVVANWSMVLRLRAAGELTVPVVIISYTEIDVHVAALVDVVMFGRQERWEYRVHRALAGLRRCWMAQPGGSEQEAAYDQFRVVRPIARMLGLSAGRVSRLYRDLDDNDRHLLRNNPALDLWKALEMNDEQRRAWRQSALADRALCQEAIDQRGPQDPHSPLVDLARETHANRYLKLASRPLRIPDPYGGRARATCSSLAPAG